MIARRSMRVRPPSKVNLTTHRRAAASVAAGLPGGLPGELQDLKGPFAMGYRISRSFAQGPRGVNEGEPADSRTFARLSWFVQQQVIGLVCGGARAERRVRKL